MRTLLVHYIKNIQAAVMPLAAVSMIAILGTAAVGVDASYWAMSKRNLQSAVDAAALAAAYEVAHSTKANAYAAADREAQLNGYEPARNGQLDVGIRLTNKDEAIIDVDISQETNIWFASVLRKEPVTLRVHATAMVADVTGEFCVFSLDHNMDGAVTVDGTANVSSRECGIAVNSSSASALELTGNGMVDVDLIRIGGSYEVSGGASNLQYRQLFENQTPMSDPYEDLTVPDHTPCLASEINQPQKVTGSGTIRLSPGIYCGGISIASTNDIIFDPGVYIIDSGDLSVIGGGSLYGKGVSFVLTSNHDKYGQVDIAGSREIYLGAPPAGHEMAGVVFYQDRNAPYRSSLTNNLTGSNELVIDGAAYFPARKLNYGGGYSTTSNSCTKVIAKEVLLSGTPILNNHCPNKEIENIGMPLVRLIR